MSNPQAVLCVQQICYRAWAPEYDDWWFRCGRYDQGLDHTRTWNAEITAIENALSGLLPVEGALEFACGTGTWTRHLDPGAGLVTAADTSPEAIAINRQRVASDRVTYIETDIFQWQPTTTYDLVFFGFWYSHIPTEDLNNFWQMAICSLKPGGVVFFIDSMPDPNGNSLSQPVRGGDCRVVEDGEIVEREHNDGRNFRIVKNYFDPGRLLGDMHRRGWQGQIRSAGEFFSTAHTASLNRRRKDRKS